MVDYWRVRIAPRRTGRSGKTSAKWLKKGCFKASEAVGLKQGSTCGTRVSPGHLTNKQELPIPSQWFWNCKLWVKWLEMFSLQPDRVQFCIGPWISLRHRRPSSSAFYILKFACALWPKNCGRNIKSNNVYEIYTYTNKHIYIYTRKL